MPSHDERHVTGDTPGGTSPPNGAVDRHGLANLALVFADVAATLGALARECTQLEGTEFSRQALAIEAELGTTESSVASTRQYLRDVARAALLK